MGSSRRRVPSSAWPNGTPSILLEESFEKRQCGQILLKILLRQLMVRGPARHFRQTIDLNHSFAGLDHLLKGGVRQRWKRFTAQHQGFQLIQIPVSIDLAKETRRHLPNRWFQYNSDHTESRLTWAMVHWLREKIDENRVKSCRTLFETIQRQAPQWRAKKISTSEGSNVNGVTSKMDLKSVLVGQRVRLAKSTHFSCWRLGRRQACETKINLGTPVDPDEATA